MNAKKTIQIFMSRKQNSGQYRNTKIGNKHLDCIAKLKHPGTNLTNKFDFVM